MFERSKWDDAVKTQGMLQTMPINKQSSFVHIDSWEEFKKKLINDFGNTDVFRREAISQFSQLENHCKHCKNSPNSWSQPSTH